MNSCAVQSLASKPYPVYFLSHGGPTFMYEDDEFGSAGAWKKVKQIGNKIKYEWKPDYIIVVSAHWQSSGSNLIEIAIPDSQKQSTSINKSKIIDPLVENSLIYDFYGFPDHMYQEEFHSKTSLNVAEAIKAHLEKNNFKSKLTPRGIDHGVWVPFKVAFSDHNTKSSNKPKTMDWDLPETSVIQVSLTSKDSDFETHYKLGQTLDYFRKNPVWDEKQQKNLTGMIICSGMSVHNLRDLHYMFKGELAPYTRPFGELLTKLVTEKPTLENFENLKNAHSKLFKSAHPTAEHFLPIVVAAGVASNDNEVGREVYNEYMGSLGWGIFQFGEN